MTDNKTFDLASIIGKVSNSDTGASGKLMMLPADKIHANDANFYTVEYVSGLVDAILLDGLQSPLVVTAKGEDYTIISGHRRFKALSQIMAEGLKIPEGKLFAEEINAGKIPCFVNTYASDLEAELALIRANSDTRVLSSAEISKQAERVEMLLYELKEQGYSFPGKMRDYVAECCQVSASKLARLKVIREKLIPEYQSDFASKKPGTINETVAYELAQLTEEDQRMIYREHPSMWTSSAKQYEGYLDNLRSIKCKLPDSGGKCGNIDKMWALICDNGYYNHMPCKYYKNVCCLKCDYMSNCKAACEACADKKTAERAKIRAEKKAENAAIRDREKQEAQRCADLFDRMHMAMAAADVDEKTACEAIGRYFYRGCLEKPDKCSPSSFVIRRATLDELSSLADLCKCSTDFLLCRTDIPLPPDELAHKASKAAAREPAQWQTGTPDKPGWVVAYFDIGGMDHPLRSLAYWDDYLQKFLIKQNGADIDAECARWLMLPEDG